MKAVWQPEPVTRQMSSISQTALLWGLDSVELRSVGGARDRVPHVSERHIRTVCEASELEIAVVDPGYLTGCAKNRSEWMNEIVMLTEVFALAQRLNSPAVMVGSMQGDLSSHDAYSNAAEQAAASDIEIFVRPTSLSELDGAARLVESVGHPACSLVWECSVASDYTLDPTLVEGLERYIDLVGYMRFCLNPLHPISLDDAERLKDLFQAVVARAKEHGYDGDVCLELDPADSETDGLRASTSLVKAVRHSSTG